MVGTEMRIKLGQMQAKGMLVQGVLSMMERTLVSSHEHDAACLCRKSQLSFPIRLICEHNRSK